MVPRRAAAPDKSEKPDKAAPARHRPQVRALRLLLRAQAHVLDDHRRHIEGAQGMLMTEFDMIAALGNTEGLRMGELAQHMITTPGNVTRVAQALEKRGLVARKRAPHSDREVFAYLTPAGEDFFRKHFPAVVGYTTAYMDERLTTAEQHQLATLLTKLLPPT